MLCPGASSRGGVVSDEQSRRERFTDEEAAFLRHVRFGELPPPIRPEDRVELTETEVRSSGPDPGPQWVAQAG
jgi:hypothetical protein